MKMNKLAAGALALALGLGAVAPAVAAEEKTAVKSELTSYEIFLKEHDAKVKEINKILAENAVAQEKRDAADAELEKAQARYEEALKAYQAQFPGVKVKDDEDKVLTVEELAQKPVDEAMEKLGQYLKSEVDEDRIRQSINHDKKRSVTDTAIALYDWAKEQSKEADGVDLEKKEYETKLALVEAIKAINYHDSKVNDKAALSAYAEYEAAKANLNAAQVKRDEVYKNNKVKEYKEELKALKEAAEGYGFSVQVGNAGLKITDKKIEQKEEFDLKKLAAAKEDAITTIKAVELLKEFSPEKIKGVRAQLDKLVAESEELIKMADYYLKDAKLALVATAYADDEEEAPKLNPAEITDKLNKNTGEMKDLIKDKDEDKEDDKDEEKPAEKPEKDEKEDDKKEEKENKPAKKAGNNARTGIAGVAGVAGILAAASVAYAASKRD